MLKVLCFITKSNQFYNPKVADMMMKWSKHVNLFFCLWTHISCPTLSSPCRDGDSRHDLLLLGGSPGARIPQRLGLPAVSDVPLHAFSFSHHLYKHASDHLQESGRGSDWIWWVWLKGWYSDDQVVGFYQRYCSGVHDGPLINLLFASREPQRGVFPWEASDI